VIRVCDGQGSTPRRNPVTIAIEEGVRAADLSRLSGCLTRVV
jgi:DnaJ-class molecular chaperone